MKLLCSTILTLAVLVSVLFSSNTTWAATAEFDPVNEESIGVTSVQLRFANIQAARKYKFQLWDKRSGRTEYRKVDTFYQKRLYKNRTHQRITLTGLKQNRDYRIRYKSIYLGDREGIWSDYLKFRTKNDSLYVYLDDEDTLLSTDQPYLITDDTNYAMTATDDNRWLVEIPDISKGQTIEYVFARNDLGARSYEQFTPDDVSYQRSVTISEIPQTREHTVTSWRLFATDNTDEISSEDWPVTARTPWKLGTTLALPYPTDLASYTDTMLTTITDAQLGYVGIPYATRLITESTDNAVTTSQRLTGYANDTKLSELITAMTAVNLEPILVIQLPIDEDNEEAILAHMAEAHNHTYFGSYLTRWREAMNDGIDLANANNIEIIVLDTSFYDTLHFANNDDEYYFNHLLENDVLPIVGSNFDGRITTAELSTDSDFTWYQSSVIDWLGDSWYPTLSNSTEPTIADMTTAATDQLTTTYDPLVAEYGKPLFFSTLGVFSIDGAASLGETILPTANAVNPDKSNDTYSLDTQEQADAYEALFRAIAGNANVVGALAPDYSYTTQLDKLSNIREKTASLVWQRWAQLFDN